MNDIIWKALLVIGSMLVALASSVGIIKWKHHDSPLEQAVERYVEETTGWDIDLSPSYAKASADRPDYLEDNGLDMVSTPASFSIEDQEIAGI